MLNTTKYLYVHNYFYTLSNEQKNSDFRAINSLLAKYGVAVSRYVESPKMIQYRAQLSPDCNITKLLKLQPNLCIALNDDSVRLFRDKSELVIEKKGAENNIFLGDLITDHFKSADGLTIALGKDMEGRNTYTNLEKAPHLLIAGTTGSGKSILLHSIICSLLIKNPLANIVTVDTKKTEFSQYRIIPNVKSVTEAEDAIAMLSNLCDEMEQRYNILAKAGCRDINSAREKGVNMQPIIVVVDEFADLMLLSGKTVEQYIVRLAQKARACGIHLVIATQRPTRDVITGLIKANIPAKICLKTTSALDSRIVFDRKGGETLLGKGDMLFLGNGAFEPVRVTGCFMEEREIRNIANLASAYTREHTKTSHQKASYAEKTTFSKATSNYFRNLFKR